MGKPDLNDVFVTASGQLYKDDGAMPLAPLFQHIPIAASDVAASGIGVPIGGVYAATGANPVLHVRIA